MGAPDLLVDSFDFHVLPMRTRFPFRYGIATLTELPHLFVRASMRVDGEPCRGLTSEGLPPKWFTKDPDATFSEELTAMLTCIEHAAAAGARSGAATSFFAWWQALAGDQERWARSAGVAGLLANLGLALCERAVIDGIARALGRPFAELVGENVLGIDLGRLHPELEGRAPAELLPRGPASALDVRHTVGLGDPIDDEGIPAEEHVADGLPHSLVAAVRTYGLTHFKVKLCGDLDRDLPRLAAISDALREAGGEVRLTLDCNEQYRDPQRFRADWARLTEDPGSAWLMSRLLFVEQPFHRDVALGAGVGELLRGWRDGPDVIIDESDDGLGALPRALALGYRGTSHKNCKGVVKGLANAALLALMRERSPGETWILSGEDLCNVGPVALHQDLAVLSVLGVTHAERNGHHYFRGLSMFPPGVQEEVLAAHPDLYERAPQGFARLALRGGRLDLGSVRRAPFGTVPLVDPEAFEDLATWRATSC